MRWRDVRCFLYRKKTREGVIAGVSNIYWYQIYTGIWLDARPDHVVVRLC